MQSLRAIETEYAGCRFRSRLEARWAVVFDRLRIEWQYEPEGFEKGHTSYDPETLDERREAIRYLPDFYLPELGTWVEVKGSDDQLAKDARKLALILDWGSPLPGFDWSYGSTRGLLVLGDIPRPSKRAPGFLLIQHHKGLFFNRATLVRGGMWVWDGGPTPLMAGGRWTCPYGDSGWGNDLRQQDPDAPCPPLLLQLTDSDMTNMDPQLRYQEAFDAGRMARFEHGETPIPVQHYLRNALK